jgi:hypothetical protein
MTTTNFCTILFSDNYAFVVEDFKAQHLPHEIILDCPSFNFDDDTIRLLNVDNISRFRETLNSQGAGRILLTLKYFIRFVDDIHVRESFRHYAECFRKKKFSEIAKIVAPGESFQVIDIDEFRRQVIHLKSYFDPMLHPATINLVREYNKKVNTRVDEIDTLNVREMLMELTQHLRLILGRRLEIFKK